jgi:hypothetical protein
VKTTAIAFSLAVASAGMIGPGFVAAKAIDYVGTIDVRPADGRPLRLIRGRVCEDLNRDTVCQPGEPGIEGVPVSNGLNVLETGHRGAYRLPLPSPEDEERGIAIFVTKPAGYNVPVDTQNVPQFYYIHKPEGSPLSVDGEVFRFGGLPPTGPPPRMINFPMIHTGKKDRFKVAISGDTQPYSNTEVGYVRDTIAREWSAIPDLEAVLIVR